MSLPNTQRLAPLAAITDMAHQAALMRLRRITAREQALRDSLADLDDRAANGFLRSLSGHDNVDGVANLGFVGGQERNWRDWISVQRASLQVDLAKVLGEKAEHMTRLTQTLGRKDVAEKMLRAAQERDRRDRSQKQMAALQELSLMLHSHRTRR
ncbi:hypothetical protein DL237_02575 [Pseudooceanicola sediminis]|uniref:Flagellar FliJ protein n=1 Tax=Pseudooceanicola sediminis TaxID=2211117 RepID=A0A399J874_9RHOB|nr:hypothetical protein [Pseudooceanicola sediminis]KAA2315577.1 hypothetical protein E0K93_06920 [Puniceibacterium sp. HSS470]RII40222.1 hypothetical protein DL237_02575 [Pseudooceanicola sediminis]|tara:strand:+ start:12323 stop:12787 length:465 start_codon:yes stop_codon:yes gene_type:complete